MIKVDIENEGLAHEIYEFIRILFPSYERENFMYVNYYNNLFTLKSDTYNFEFTIDKSDNLQRNIKKKLIEAINNNNLKVPDWGVLHGIRPLKLAYKLLNEKGEKNAKDILKFEYKVSAKKIKLMFEIINIQKEIIDKHKNNYSIYVHIPFCPTKCTYCSYQTLNSNSQLVDKYVEKIITEIRSESRFLRKNPSSIYIGGGTPTSIGVENLENIIKELKFNFGTTEEFTVEAGRVETLDNDMINMLYNYGVDRISINPQSMNEKTIKKINRTNSVKEFINCYDRARDKFKNINMDLIIGLEDETEQEFLTSLNSVIDLEPTNITIHSLSIKNGTQYLKTDKKTNINSDLNDTVISILKQKKYNPYYLYRQKRIIGGNENIGYSLSGYECIYNIMMIQEFQDIWGFGMSSTSKIHLENGKFEQIANFRDIKEYLIRSDEIFEKKLKLIDENRSKYETK